MLSNYDFTLVATSYVVAILAAYCALFFGARLTAANAGERRNWLIAGGLVMGTGIWTMHFVGMSAMPMELSFHAGMTFISWLAAVVASGIALSIIAKGRLGAGLFALAVLLMSSGIVVMHYLGMYAMRMSAPPVFDLFWLAISVAIAVGASAAALAICRRIRRLHGAGAAVFRFFAAVVMAAAICGMHYSGMIAMTFPQGAMPAPDNGMSGDWMGIPLALFSAAFLAVGLVVTILDVRHQRTLERISAEEDSRVERMLYTDRVTALPNRLAFEQRVLEELATDGARKRPFAMVSLDVANYRELAAALDHGRLDEAVRDIAGELKSMIAGNVYLARYSTATFMLLFPLHKSDGYSFMYKRLRELDGRIVVHSIPIRWQAGQSAFPHSGSSSLKLIRTAMIPGEMSNIGRFVDGHEIDTPLPESRISVG